MTKRVSLPPEMIEFFSAYMDPADLLNAQLVETSDNDTREHTAPPPIEIWVSFHPKAPNF